ncbi:hypothetical protein U9M48_006402 [Paspalum notatum var. saurae]|uniref:Alcohol dehydrogenase n=1 Tax=Paspalum notatum var. saurae TaxID=547442 RepID=A0AAQ3PXS5_PASNO
MTEDQSPRPIRCKAAVCRAAGEPLVIEEIVVDPPKAYEIRIKIICTSLCHTDITFWQAKVAPVFPRILGHEAYGYVHVFPLPALPIYFYWRLPPATHLRSVGEHVEGFAAGDTVVPTLLGQCDSCGSCASEQNNMCAAVPFAMGPGMRRDGTTRFWDAQGNPLHDLLAVSSFTEYTVMDVNQVVKIDPAVSPKLACLLSCGAGTGVGAAWKLAKVEPGSSVAVFGLGSVGLAVTQGAKMCGASRIIGKSFGVTDFVNPSQLDKSSVCEVITEMTGGGVDCSFECVGVPSVVTDAFRCTRPGNGKTIVLGLGSQTDMLCLPAFELLFGKCIIGSPLGGMKPKTDIPVLAKKCMSKELELEGLVTHEVGLEEINKAFDLLLQGKSLRCMIWMDNFAAAAQPAAGQRPEAAQQPPIPVSRGQGGVEARASALCPPRRRTPTPPRLLQPPLAMEDQSPKPIHCKAAVCRAAGEPLTIEEIVVDPPKVYEIRIKIICTSLCHTDITFWKAKVLPVFPRILGHEAYGVVESVGKLVEGFAAGDSVVPTFLGQCDSCGSCTSSEQQNNMCASVPFIIGPGMRRDGTTRFWDAQGKPLHDLLAVSSFSEYTVVDMNQVVKIDPAVPPRLACLLSCGGSTGVGAAWRSAKVEPGSSVAIFGLGSVGLAVVQGKSFGVTHFINPSLLDKSSVREVIIEMTGGGVDYSFECIGVSSVMTDAFRSTKMGKGKTIILGLGKDSDQVSLPSLELLFGRCVMGTVLGGLKPKSDIPILAKKCIDKELELEALVTHELGLKDINKAFDLLLQGKSLRCMIWMDKDK